MGTQGSNGVSLTSAARIAATAAACRIPAIDARTAHDPARRPHTPPHGGADRFGPPRPGATDCTPRPVIGGGAATPAVRPGVAPDPALAALAGMLGNATPPPRGVSVLQQLTTSLSTLLASIAARLGAMLPASADHGAAAPMAATSDQATAELPRADPSLVLRQPPPPIGPILSLDPATGMIVDPRGEHGSGHGAGGEGAPEDRQAVLPSSWVPVPSGVFAAVRRRLGSIADRIDALLGEVGMTRLQLLLLMLLGPVAVAFAIDVVAQLMAQR